MPDPRAHSPAGSGGRRLVLLMAHKKEGAALHDHASFGVPQRCVDFKNDAPRRRGRTNCNRHAPALRTTCDPRCRANPQRALAVRPTVHHVHHAVAARGGNFATGIYGSPVLWVCVALPEWPLSASRWQTCLGSPLLDMSGRGHIGVEQVFEIIWSAPGRAARTAPIRLRLHLLAETTVPRKCCAHS